MIERIVVLMVSVGLCAPMAQAGIVATGDVIPADPATWTTSTTAYIGNTGMGSITVDDESDLVSGYSYLGYHSGSTGAVTVSGAGSTWTNSGSLYVGYERIGTLNITGGGQVSSSWDVYVGHDCTSMGDVTVDGAGSTWTGMRDLHVGYFGGGTVNITNGSQVSNEDGYIGYGLSSMSDVTVDGAGSTWTNSGSLYVGYGDLGSEGSGWLNITGGSEVTVGEDTWVSYDPTSSGAIHFGNGTLTTGGLLCNPDDLTGTGTINTNGLVSDVDLVFDTTHGLSQSFAINENLTVNMDVDGSGSLGAGHSGVGTLSIADGRDVQSSSGYVGHKSGSTGTVTVNGAGSTWTNSSSLYVGRYGGGTLNITGGQVSNDIGYIGNKSGSTGSVTVDGLGSTWTNSGGLYVGDEGSGTLNITGSGIVSSDGGYFVTGGGTVSSDGGYIADDSGSTGAVTVGGACSTWMNSSYLYVGNGGNGTLSITGGGAVTNTYGYIGDDAGSTGEVTVDGLGSTWTNSGYFYVGFDGSGTLDITGGGTVVSSDLSHIGLGQGSTGEVTVNGPGSTWTNSDDFYVAAFGSGTLNITRGGTVTSSGYGFIGAWSGSTGEVTVDGPGSTWTNSRSLYVGYYGNGTLNITGGGEVSNGWGCRIGYGSGSTGEVTVDGAASTLTNNDDLVIGDNGSGTLNITGGSTVTNRHGFVGTGYGSTGAVTVDGAGSTWTNDWDLYVGRNGNGTLNITGGGTVSNDDGQIGYWSGSTGEVTVDGPGSTWTNSS